MTLAAGVGAGVLVGRPSVVRGLTMRGGSSAIAWRFRRVGPVATGRARWTAIAILNGPPQREIRVPRRVPTAIVEGNLAVLGEVGQEPVPTVKDADRGRDRPAVGGRAQVLVEKRGIAAVRGNQGVWGRHPVEAKRTTDRSGERSEIAPRQDARAVSVRGRRRSGNSHQMAPAVSGHRSAERDGVDPTPNAVDRVVRDRVGPDGARVEGDRGDRAGTDRECPAKRLRISIASWTKS